MACKGREEKPQHPGAGEAQNFTGDADTLAEEAGFEPPVPLAKRVGLSGGTVSALEAKRAVSKASSILQGTGGSNPAATMADPRIPAALTTPFHPRIVSKPGTP